MVAPMPDGRIARSMVRVPGSGTDETAGLLCLNLGNVSSFAGIVPIPQNLFLNTRNGRQQMMSSLNLVATKQNATSLSTDDVTSSEEKVDSPSNSHAGEDSEEKVDSPTQNIAAEDSSHSIPVGAVASVTDVNRDQLPTPPRDAPTGTMRSSLKRPLRQDSTEEPTHVPKRYKAMAAISTIPSGTQSTNGVSSMPMLLPVASTSGTMMTVPVSVAHNSNGVAPSFFLPGLMTQANTQLQGFPWQSSLPGAQGVQQMLKEREQLKKENLDLKMKLYRFHQLLKNKQKLITVLRHLEAVPS